MTDRRLLIAAFLSLSLPLSASPALATDTAAEADVPRAMTLVDLIELPTLSDPQLSPDGGQAAFVLAEVSWEENKRISHLWRTDLQAGTSEQLTFGDEGQTSPRWSPDGRWIAFLAQRDKDEHAQI